MKYLYTITCVPNGKMYIGSTKNFKKRVYAHLLTLRNNNHANKYLQDDYNKFGEASFSFDLVNEYNLEIDADRAERFYILSMGINDKNGHYNIDLSGNWATAGNIFNRHGSDNPFFGKRHSEDTINKISDSKKGKSSVWKFRPFTEEMKKNMSISAKKRGVEHLKIKIRDTISGVVYNSIKDYCSENGYNYSTIKYKRQKGTLENVEYLN